MAPQNPPDQALTKAQTLQHILAVPETPAEREHLGEQLWQGIVIRFQEKLSSEDLELWKNPPENWYEVPEHRRLIKRFEYFLLEEFLHFGPMVLLSHRVLSFIFEWDQRRPKFLRLMGEALERHSNTYNQKEIAPINEGLIKSKPAAVAELKELLRKSRLAFKSKRRDPISLEMADWLKDEIESNRNIFKFLWANLGQFYGFVAELDKRDKTTADRLARGGMPATEFFYRWVARNTGREFEQVRQIISRRKPVGLSRRAFLSE